jgi:hypothetical protein
MSCVLCVMFYIRQNLANKQELHWVQNARNGQSGFWNCTRKLVHWYECMYACMYMCVCVYVYIYVCLYYVCMCVCVCVCMHACMYVCVCLFVRMYVCMYKQIHEWT